MREKTGWLATGGVPAPQQIVSPDSHSRVLLAAAARALHGRDCDDLRYLPTLSRFRSTPEPLRRAALARAAARAAVAPDRVGDVDADRIAQWVVEQYPQRWYPGVVVGSPHGGAVHLATAMGVPWLPSEFEMAVHWPHGSVDDAAGALVYGGTMADRFLPPNPALAVRQVHDPAGRGHLVGCTITLVARWRRLPDPYRRFLGACLAPAAPMLMLRDARTWPVLDAGTRHSFQVGAPASGLDPDDYVPGSERFGQVLRHTGGDRARWRAPALACPTGFAEHSVEPAFEESLRGWAEAAGSALHRVLFPRPEALSAATADLYRGWLRAAGKTGNRCVVECGRLIDPWQVVRAGMVPYWCENAARRTVAAAEWWLAGSAAFSSVDVLPEPPGLESEAVAGLAQWRAVASFGRRRAALDRVAVRGYPGSPVPTRRATEVLRGQPYDLPRPAPLPLPAALAGLRDSGTPLGLLVC
ncbi:hypothetical protein SAMN05444365_11811 [Micromonospora pattaloongensis]|uniref:Uncharacterized protein n=1 Tax=Micromonospora pattaloongensis TaxID=405436 RepID=A0A1H3T7D5_9ACTN|nr:hypothetical protein [Micromonospora pattaloongensis]SDZ45239.1 hypothetical protein SAMN05444365_11811 [Micromonospora pattaloongensis]